jgi:hypothetical protein
VCVWVWVCVGVGVCGHYAALAFSTHSSTTCPRTLSAPQNTSQLSQCRPVPTPTPTPPTVASS